MVTETELIFKQIEGQLGCAEIIAGDTNNPVSEGLIRVGIAQAQALLLIAQQLSEITSLLGAIGVDLTTQGG